MADSLREDIGSLDPDTAGPRHNRGMSATPEDHRVPVVEPSTDKQVHHPSEDTNEDDLVCRIVRGELETNLIYRDAQLVAFLDHRPVFPGHVLVCPVAHVADFDHLPTDLMTPLLSLAQRISRAQQEVLGAQGNFVALNNVVSQSVPHLHLHVIPRKFKDGLRGFFWPRRRYQPGEDAAIAALLRENLAQKQSNAR